ncbi:hypothetical protein, partial [Klebsiella pneumoniae]|uniref:hypothetical protein n=1 Tax=Klebsiella pneumoniae TaxID=573 RepID=UPI0039C364AF
TLSTLPKRMARSIPSSVRSTSWSLKVKVTKDEPDYLNKLNDVPPIKKNEVNAKVLVKDGETMQLLEQDSQNINTIL